MAGADSLLASMRRRSEFALVKYVPSRFMALRGLVGCQDRCTAVSLQTAVSSTS